MAGDAKQRRSWELVSFPLFILGCSASAGVGKVKKRKRGREKKKNKTGKKIREEPKSLSRAEIRVVLVLKARRWGPRDWLAGAC